MNYDYADTMRRCLEECDVATVRKLWIHVAPEMPQPKSDGEALAIIHHARTQCEIVTFPKRAYSHCWLKDHGLPSALPDQLKPKAERMYPRIVSAVGIACGSTSKDMKPVVDLVQRAMEDAVSSYYADGVTDPDKVKLGMQEARKKTIKQLLGR